MISRLLGWKRRQGATAELRPGRTRRALQFPLPVPVRTAILEKGFTPERDARVFDPADIVALKEWAPEAIVAPLSVVKHLANQRQRGLLELPSLRAAVVVLTDIGGEQLAEEDRELLWGAFGVPVFEQLRGGEGVVLARECEAHDGLHVDPAARIAHELTSLNAAMVNEPCECGADTPRLRNYLSTRLPNALGTWNVVAPVGRQAI